MKLNKLLFFFFALVGLNSCVEYVDNGVKPDNGDSEKRYVVEQSNPNEAKYIGDIFEFKTKLNNVDVTASSKFKVNGTEIKGNTYTAHKEGENSIIATMDNYSASIKFKVLKKSEESN